MHTHLLVLRPRVAQAARSRGLSAFGRSLSEEGQKGIRQLPVFSERHAHTHTRLISMNHSEFLSALPPALGILPPTQRALARSSLAARATDR